MPKPIISGPYRTFRDLNPKETFIEYEASTITIPLRVKLPGGNWEEERLKLAAYMRLEVFPAYINKLGTREFQFIIRDWELCGYSTLLNKLFMGDERGYLAPGANPKEGREQAVMTFTVSKHYIKYGDDDNLNFRSTHQLKIYENTVHDTHDNNLYWQIEENKNGFTVKFHNKPPDESGESYLKSKDDDEYIVAECTGLKADQLFEASLVKERNTVLSEGNTVLTSNLKLITPMSISWQLGKKPQAGSSGKIHIVSPPKSVCVAENGPLPGEPHDFIDFPARISYSASYDIYINDTRFVEDQAGVAIAVGVDRIPPVDVQVAFEKPHSGTVLGKYLEFSSGCCTGMIEIPEKAYRRGVEIARYWRTTRLDVQKDRKPDTFKY